VKFAVDASTNSVVNIEPFFIIRSSRKYPRRCQILGIEQIATPVEEEEEVAMRRLYLMRYAMHYRSSGRNI